MKIKLSVVLLLSAIIVLTGCSSKHISSESNESVIPVVTQVVKRVSVKNEISVSGNIEGSKTVKLGFLVSGRISYIAADEGSLISSGQLLAGLDPENYSIAKEIAEANLDQVQDEYDRLSIMHQRGSVSDGDFSKISNGLRQAKAQLKLQIKNLSDTKLYCPFNGVLLKKGTEVGEIIGTGVPLFVVSDISTVKVNAAVPETELNKINKGDEAKVYISSLDNAFTGRVIEIGSLADAATRTFPVKIEINNPGLRIRPGMTAEVKFISYDKVQVIAISGDAVLHESDNSSYVYIVDVSQNMAFKRIVTVGKVTGNNIEIISGINENELVVVGGQFKLKNGSIVSISNGQ